MKFIYDAHIFPMIIFAVGCSDYNLFDKPKNEDAELLPILDANPIHVDLGILCASSEEQTTVQLSNVGMGLLVIETMEVEGDWLLLDNPVPTTLQPNEILSVPISVGFEPSVLIVYSNDPNQDVLQIPLEATIDQAPELNLIAPIDGSIIQSDTLFSATVSDDIDPSEYLMVQWTSNVDGLFSTGEAFADGTVETMWNAYHSSGYHTIEISVVDSCSNVTRDRLHICQQLSYEVDSFDISSWHFEGDALWNPTEAWLELTPTTRYSVGTAFSTSQEVPAGWVDISFEFFIGNGTGADGISLTALDVDRMSSFLGGTGCGIGYGGDADCTSGPALPGWSVEIDTYYNVGYDPTPDDHVMFTFDGDVDNPVVWAPLPEMEDSGWHRMHVRIQEPHVFVEIDGVTYIDQEVPGFYDFDAYVGFTAGTGDYTNQHIINELVVTEQLCGD